MKNILHKIILISAFSVLIALPVITLAADKAPVADQKAAAATTAQEQRMTNLKRRADTEVERRLTELNAVDAKINAIARLTAEQKTATSEAINENVVSLTALKTKIDADTDLATLKTDVKSIVDSYRIFALFVPKIHILTASTVITDVTTKLTALATKLEARLTEASAKGKDVAALNASLVEMKTKIAEANAKATSASTVVSALAPDGFPGNKGSLQSALADLKAARAAIVVAKQDATAIIQGIKVLDAAGTETGSTTSPTPTSSPTSTPAPTSAAQ